MNEISIKCGNRTFTIPTNRPDALRFVPEPPAPSDNWRQNMTEALAARECKSPTEWAAKFPGEHCMFYFRGFRSCALCGVCEARDPLKQKPCRGIVKIELRGDSEP